MGRRVRGLVVRPAEDRQRPADAASGGAGPPGRLDPVPGARGHQQFLPVGRGHRHRGDPADRWRGLGRRTTSPDVTSRALHPGAWWVWALALAVAASRTTNPLLLGLVIAIIGFVVANRRSDAPWALAFRLYAYVGAVIVATRVLFRILIGGEDGGHILFTLPRIPLPAVRGRGVAARLDVGGGAARRLLRRPPAGDDGALRRRGERPGQPETPAQGRAGGVVRGRHGRDGGAHGGAAARRERAARPAGPAAAGGADSRAAGGQGHRGAGAGGRDEPLAAAGGRDGLARLRPPRVPEQPACARRSPVVCWAGWSACASASTACSTGRRRGWACRCWPSGWSWPRPGSCWAGGASGGRPTGRTRGARPETLVVASGVGACALLFFSARVDPGNLYPSLSPLSWPEVSLLAGVVVAARGAARVCRAPPPSLSEVVR